MASGSRMSADIDRWVSILPHRAELDRGVGARREKGACTREGAMGHRIHEGEEKGREQNRRERERKKERKRERQKDGGDFQHAPQPLVFFSPGTEKGGPYAPYAGGERACAGCTATCVGLRPSNKCVAHIGACVRTLHAITASRTGGVDRRGRLYERQSDPGNLMRN